MLRVLLAVTIVLFLLSFNEWWVLAIAADMYYHRLRACYLPLRPICNKFCVMRFCVCTPENRLWAYDLSRQCESLQACILVYLRLGRMPSSIYMSIERQASPHIVLLSVPAAGQNAIQHLQVCRSHSSALIERQASPRVVVSFYWTRPPLLVR